MPSPGRMRGVRVISSTFVPCVARSTGFVGVLVVQVDEARVNSERVRDGAIGRAPLRGRAKKLTAAIVSVSRRRWRADSSTFAILPVREVA